MIEIISGLQGVEWVSFWVAGERMHATVKSLLVSGVHFVCLNEIHYFFP